MGELARKRRARDIWISKGHLWAVGVALVLLTGLGFIGGLWVGGLRSPAPAARAASTTDASLVDLLARVDRRVVADDGVGTLTYADSLVGIGSEPEVPELRVEPMEPAIVPGSYGSSPPVDVVIKVDEESRRASLAQALEQRAWQVEPVEGGLRVASRLDRSDAVELREDLMADLSEAGLSADLELRLAAAGAE